MDKHDPSAPPMPVAVPVVFPDSVSIVAAPSDNPDTEYVASTSGLLQKSLDHMYRYSWAKVNDLCVWVIEKTKKDPDTATLDQALNALRSRVLHLHRIINHIEDLDRECERELLVARQHTMDANAVLQMGRRRVTESRQVILSKLRLFHQAVSEEAIENDMDVDQLMSTYARIEQSINKLLASPPATNIRDDTALRTGIKKLSDYQDKVNICKGAEQTIIDRRTELQNQIRTHKAEVDRVEQLIDNLKCRKM